MVSCQSWLPELVASALRSSLVVLLKILLQGRWSDDLQGLRANRIRARRFLIVYGSFTGLESHRESNE